MQAMLFLDKIISNIHDIRYRKVVEFVFLWQDYNYWYNRKNPDIVNQRGMPLDAEQALRLSEDEIAINIYNMYKEDFVSSFECIPASFDKKWVRDRLRCTGPYQQEVFYNRKSCDLKDFLALVYQIRCNFIHGSKEGDDIDIALIGWARDCLGVFLDAIDYMRD